MKMRTGLMAGALLALTLTAGAGSQQTGSFPKDPTDPAGAGPAEMPQPVTPASRSGGSSRTQFPSVQDTIPNPMAKPSDQQLAAMNQARQKQIVSDTDKLLTLALELKTDVNKSSKDTLSLDVIRKADEIEKLAHNVKEKMRQ